MSSTFWPNRICERQSSQNRHTGLKFSAKRENSALSMKIVQNARFSSCAARFGQIAFLSVKVLKFVKLAWNSRQKWKTVRFPWKLYKTLVSGHAQHVLAKSHLWGSKFSKSSHWPQILCKTGKQCAFHENCTKRSFQVMRSTFWPNRIFERQSCQNRHTGLKFSPKRENSTLSIKIVQNALFRSCGARFGQIAFLSVKVVKIVTLSNSLQNGKTVRFEWKLYKTLFSGHAQHLLAKSHFWASKLSKSSHWPQILFKTGKQCAFHENCTKRSFQVMRSTFWPNRICEGQTCQNRHTGLKFSAKRENSALSMKIVQNALFRSCGARFGQIAFCQSWVTLVKAFHKNCTKSSHWPQSSLVTKRENSALSMKIVQNARFRSCAARFGQIAFVRVKVLKNTGLKFSSKRENSALSMKIVQNPLFRSWAARFGQIAFVSVKVLKIVNWPQILCKTGKQCAFHENCTKRSFQVMSTQIAFFVKVVNRHTGENSALFMKIVQNPFFRSCRARFGQIAFLSVKVVKIVTLALNSLQKGKTALSMKIVETLVSGHASTFWPNRICERQSCQNRHTGLKFSPKRENSALSIKIVQNALFRSCGARFGQIAFLSVKVVKIVTLASNSLRENGFP